MSGLNIFRTSSPTNRGMTGAPLTTDHEHMAFLAMRRERKRTAELLAKTPVRGDVA